LNLAQVDVEAIEARVPEASGVLDPVRYFFQSAGFKPQTRPAGGGRVGADRNAGPERQALLASVRNKSSLLQPFSLGPAERGPLAAYLQAL
jgi:hypothetical protein